MNTPRAQEVHDMLHNVAMRFDIPGYCLVIGEGYVAPFEVKYEQVGGVKITLPSDSKIYEYDPSEVPMSDVLKFWFKERGYESGTIICLTEDVRRQVEEVGVKRFEREDEHYSLVTGNGCEFDVYTPFKSRRFNLCGFQGFFYDE